MSSHCGAVGQSPTAVDQVAVEVQVGSLAWCSGLKVTTAKVQVTAMAWSQSLARELPQTGSEAISQKSRSNQLRRERKVLDTTRLLAASRRDCLLNFPRRGKKLTFVREGSNSLVTKKEVERQDGAALSAKAFPNHMSSLSSVQHQAQGRF